MSDDIIRVCIDPPQSVQTSGVHQRMALMTGAAWGAGRQLRVKFLEGAKAIRDKVRAQAVKWQQHANVKFLFVENGDADIRISFTKGGSSSYVGNEAETQQPDQKLPTMNYGWLAENTADDEYQRVVLHEFGHALGCIHEHQNPAGGIQWNKDKVYQWYFDNMGWNKARVDHNVLETYDQDLLTASEVDPLSIMMYPVDASLTTNGFSAGWNRDFSENDKTFIKKLYPF